MWDLPGPGIEPVSPALTSRFLTTVPPGKSYLGVLELSPIKNETFGKILTEDLASFVSRLSIYWENREEY